MASHSPRRHHDWLYRRPDDTIFVASSGHELGHHGLDAFLRAHPELIKGARAWIHLGADIGAASGQMRLESSDEDVESRALHALEEADASIGARAPRGTVPSGEARNIHVGGGRYASLLGSGPAFHTRQIAGLQRSTWTQSPATANLDGQIDPPWWYQHQ